MSTLLFICLLPLVFLAIFFLVVGFFIARDIAEDRFRNYLKNHGQKTEGIIIESEQYIGDGFHGADPCFKGRFEFKDHRGKRHRGKFAHYCFEPYDFANSEYSFQDAVKRYGKGSIIDVYYISWFPRLHIESIIWRKAKTGNP